MKHIPSVTVTLILFFFAAQVIGLLVVNEYIDHRATAEAHEVVYKPLPYNLERPEVQNQSTSFIWILASILLGTGFLLLIVKTKKPFFWKIMFFISVATTLSVALTSFMNNILAGILAIAIAAWRLYRPNMIIHNISEVFIYGGLAAIFVPMLNVFAALMLLIGISIYDYIAVYRTKHMVKLAKFQSESKVFAGLMIPYERNKTAKEYKKMPVNSRSTANKQAASKKSAAILGGGDIGFTLIFAGVVMKGLMLQETFFIGFMKALIIPLIVSLALLFLLVKGRKDKFYPAMPILSLGCFIGYLVVWII